MDHGVGFVWWRQSLCGCVDSRQEPKKGEVPLSAVQGSILQFGGQSVFLGEKSSFTIINSGDSDSSQPQVRTSSRSSTRKRNVSTSDSDSTLRPQPSRQKYKRQKKAALKRAQKKNSKEFCANLERQYSKFQDNDKWNLPSGRSVEEVLVKECQRLDEPAFNASFYPSFVIPVNHGQSKPPIFTTEEWKAILDSEVQLPKRRSNLLQPYRQVRSAADLQSAVDGRLDLASAHVNASKETTTSPRKEKDTKPGTKNEDSTGEKAKAPPSPKKEETTPSSTPEEDVTLRRWVRSCFDQLLFLQSSNRISETNSENWLNIQLWSQFLDKAILTIPEITLHRGETCSQATAERRNRGRESHTERQRIGRRLDGLFTLRGGNALGLELGGIECSKFNPGARNTKCLKDSLKLARAMRDMMVILQEHYPTIRRKLRVVGVICAGLTLRMFVMENPAGQICLFRALEPVHVPVDFNLRALAKLILQVAQFRDILKDVVEDLGKCQAEALSQLTDEEEGVVKKEEHTLLMFSADTD